MKRSILLLLVITSIAFRCFSQHKNNANEKKLIKLIDIVNRIDSGYKVALDSMSDKQIELVEAEITFTLSSTSSANAGLNLWVFKLGRKRESKKLSTVSFTLTKPPTDREFSKILKKDLKSDLDIFNLINNAAKDFESLNKTPSLSQLSDRGFVVEAGLSISKTSSAGFTISVFGAEAALDRTKDQGHSIKLTFKRKTKTIIPKI